jgi:hypothetical protein
MRLKPHSGSADVTPVTEPRPESPVGEPSPGATRPPTPRPGVSSGPSPETVDVVLRRFRDRSVAPPPAGPVTAPTAPTGPVTAPAAPAEPAFVAPPTPLPDPTDDAQWTFRPDTAEPEPGWPFQKVDAGHDPNLDPPRHRIGMARKVGVVIAIGVLFTGASALTHIGPFHTASRAGATPTTLPGTAPDLRGEWTTLNAYADVPYVTSMHITTEDLSTGAFSGVIPSPFGLEIIKGTVTGTAVSFTIDLGSGSEQGSAVVSTSKNKTRIQGSFSNSSGGRGMFVATRTG